MMLGPLILLLLAHHTLSQDDSRNYHFVNQLKTWYEAQAYCRQHFTDLATITTQEEWDKFKQLLVASGHAFVWMGLYDDMDGWTWSIDDAPLNDADIDSFPQALNLHKKERHCVSFWAGGLYDSDCDSTYRSVCYDAPTNTYIPVTVPMTWESAKQHCRETYTGLTSMRGQQEKDNVLSGIAVSWQWWIGLSRGPRKWSDGSNSSFRDWDFGQPLGVNHDCGCAAVLGWHDCECSWYLPFFCWNKKATVFKVGLKTGGSLDLNDTQAQQSVLMQIGQRIPSHQDFRMRWMKQPNGEIFFQNATHKDDL